MKPALLAACCATAVASAAEPKDPAAVARDWEKTLAEAPVIHFPTGLRNQVQTPPILPENTFQETPLWKLKPQKPRTNPFGDGPLRPPDHDKDERPRSAKPYRFNDGTYWLVPLTT